MTNKRWLDIFGAARAKRGWAGIVAGAAMGALAAAGCQSDEHAGHTGHEGHTVGKTGAAPEVPEGTIWTCAMHPQIRQPKPGKCPICGMDLIPVTSAGGEAGGAGNRVELSERARALAKLQTVPVARQDGAAVELRLLGRLEPDETTLKTITAWTGGRIDKLHVRVTGEKVRAGQVIATLYSPEVFAAHQDLIAAKKQVAGMAQSPETARQAAEAALQAARERLRLLGVPDGELSAMETQEKPGAQTAIRTPFAGTVIERMATEGAYVMTGAPLYQVANLSRLWVQLDAYETDLPKLAVGQTVRVEVESFAGEAFQGRIRFVDPTLDPARRTARVRVEVENPDGRLRPGMFAQALVAGKAKDAGKAPLVIPASAPLFTGKRAVVYVEVPGAEKPTYEARTVRLGPRLGEVYPVVAGLAEGEHVVARGAFAVDADLQIRGGQSMMSEAGDAEASGAGEPVVTAADRAALKEVMAGYLEIQAALAADDLKVAKAAATALGTGVGKVALPPMSAAKDAWHGLAKALLAHVPAVEQAVALETARAGFEHLSGDIQMLLRRFGNPLATTVRLAYCPMAFGDKGALWVQKGETIDNSYFGESMRSCGVIRAEVPPGGTLASGAGKPAGAAGHKH